jgi:hypothetical protein
VNSWWIEDGPGSDDRGRLSESSDIENRSFEARCVLLVDGIWTGVDISSPFRSGRDDCTVEKRN